MIDDTTQTQASDELPPPASTAGIVSPETYAIQVVGAMNPSIHHPLWYQHHGLLSETEVSGALPSLITSPPFALFTFAGCTIQCRQDQWTIITSDANCRGRILDIAARVFDDLLAHTPVTSFALNNAFHHLLTTEARPALARVLLEGGLPPVPQPDTATFAFAATGPNASRISFRVEPSVSSPVAVFVALESNYPIQSGTGIEFALRPLLERSYDSDLRQAQVYVAALVQTLNSLGGEANASSGR
jgi:hypothetical protein